MPTATPAPDPAIRVIYATPSDVEPRPTYLTSLEAAIYNVQDWYAEHLDGQTFALHTPTAEHCELDGVSDRYATTGGWDQAILDLQGCADVLLNANAYSELRDLLVTRPSWSWAYQLVPLNQYYTWIIYVDVASDCMTSELGRGGPQVAMMGREDLIGLTNPEGNDNHCGRARSQGGYLGGTAHELAHSFGRPHPPGCEEALDTCDQEALMWWGYDSYPNTYFTADDVGALKASPWLYVTLTKQ